MTNLDTASPFGERETPLAVLDTERLEANLRRLQARADALGVALRPHVKTAKCIPVAQRQRALGARGITVSTLREADTFFAAGFDDILYAVGIAPNKLPHALRLVEQGCRLQVIVDSLAAAQAVVSACRSRSLVLPVLVEIDVDGLRAGVAPEDPALLDIARCLHDGGLLQGVMTHGGGSYASRSQAALQAFAEQERRLCVDAATRLRAAGLPCPVVSTGSTPTALAAAHADGVTEVRAGVYVFFDLVMAGLGVCTPQDIALSVLTSVIGHQPDKGWVLVDAGWMALSRDRGTQDQGVDQGYGLVCDEGGRVLDDWIVGAANQEHGIVVQRAGGRPADLRERFPLGSRLRILPNHACATAAQFDRYLCVTGGQPGESWARFGGW